MLQGPLPPRPTAVSACAGAIRRAILQGEVAAGAKLPPERDLARTFGVNRATLRGALRELASSGLLSVRQGSGYAVRDFRTSGGPDLVPTLVELAREAGDLRAVVADLLLVRRQLARAVLERLVAARPSRAALRDVERAIQELEGLAGGGGPASPAGIARADLGVVRAIVAATGSPVLAVFINPIEAILESIPEIAVAMYADPAVNAAAYRALLASFGDGRPALEAALEALEERDAATLARLGAPLRAAKRSRS